MRAIMLACSPIDTTGLQESCTHQMLQPQVLPSQECVSPGQEAPLELSLPGVYETGLECRPRHADES